MKTETEFVSTEKIIFLIEKIVISKINLDDIVYVDIYINDKKNRFFYRIEQIICLDYFIFCKNSETLKVVVETKKDKKVKTVIAGNSIYIFSED